jgi:magnesium-transporting ATPase (P-type)
MNTEFVFATLFNLGMNLVYTVLALILGVAALVVIDKKLLKSTEVEKELKEGNIAMAIFASTVLLFVALIVSFGLKG